MNEREEKRNMNMGEKGVGEGMEKGRGDGEAVQLVSVVVPICERHDDITKLYVLYAQELRKMQLPFEFLFVLGNRFRSAYAELQKLRDEGEPITIIRSVAELGESAALMEGFRQARGNTILTLASYIQVEPTELPGLFEVYDEGNELVITRRWPRRDPLINRLQSRVYHWLVGRLTGTAFRDITSGMRLISKKVLPELVLYGDLHRFIPIFADKRGIRVKEVCVSQRDEDTKVRVVKPGIYLRRLLDILTLFFLIKFTTKPLRFFGLIGFTLSVAGVGLTGYLGILRLVTGAALSNRPLLLLGILFMVFGIQLFSVGLVGELIIFCHAKELKGYEVEKVVE